MFIIIDCCNSLDEWVENTFSNGDISAYVASKSCEKSFIYFYCSTFASCITNLTINTFNI